jgi:hypothetical protein
MLVEKRYLEQIVYLYFYIFNQQRFRAGKAMNSSSAASPVRR